MLIDLNPLFHGMATEIQLCHSLDLSQTISGDPQWFSHPVQVNGQISNSSGVLVLEADISTTLSMVCDRCMESFDRPLSLHITHVLAKGKAVESDQATILVEDGCLNLDELVYSDMLFDLPTKTLCKKNCAGICPICGVNRNITRCDCSM